MESITFYLLHLSLMREYLDLEFQDIAHILPFDYNLERVIDDFILLAVFIGNDFLPHLPDLHIHENGLERLFDVYMKVLPSLGAFDKTVLCCSPLTSVFSLSVGGYLQDSGVIDTKRLQVILNEMADWEQGVFEKEFSDLNWYKGKQTKHVKELEKKRNESQRGTSTTAYLLLPFQGS